eukprot:gene16307-21610_t
MIVVVGPSGAGKDSLIDFARDRLAGEGAVVFVRRFVTRGADAGNEDHQAVSLEAFERMRDAGAFAVHWGAHDLHYGIPADTRMQLAAGMTLIANGSRGAIARNNHIEGLREGRTSRSGSGVSVWNAPGAKVIGNDVSFGRDGIFANASKKNEFRGNTFSNLRFA